MKYTKLFSVLTLGTVLLAGAASAAEVTVTTRTGRGADAVVQTGPNINKNLGGHAYLALKHGVLLDYARKSYIRFDIGAGAGAIHSARLVLTLGNSFAESPADKAWSFSVYGVRDGLAAHSQKLGEDWDEKSITWNNAPANDTGSSHLMDADAALLGTFTVMGKGTPGQSIVFSGDNLARFLRTDTNGMVTLVITRNDMGTRNGVDDVVHIFLSKEQRTGAPPTLILER